MLCCEKWLLEPVLLSVLPGSRAGVGAAGELLMAAVDIWGGFSFHPVTKAGGRSTGQQHPLAAEAGCSGSFECGRDVFEVCP